MPLARDLCFQTLDALLQRFPDLTELRPAGRPFRMLPTAQNPEAGAVRVWNGRDVARVVYIGLRNELPARDDSGRAMAVDSHMLFAFTDKESAVPHFTLDSVEVGPMLAFHLDLIPRVDLGVSLAYMDAVYGGAIDAAQAEARGVQGFTPAQLSSRQLAIMSPWMLAQRATPEAFAKLPVKVYFEQWVKLLREGLPAAATEGLSGADFARRDARNRAVLFNRDVDPVWPQIERAIGAETGVELRALLQRQDRELAR